MRTQRGSPKVTWKDAMLMGVVNTMPRFRKLLSPCERSLFLFCWGCVIHWSVNIVVTIFLGGIEPFASPISSPDDLHFVQMQLSRWCKVSVRFGDFANVRG